jgi:hypothetical protein
MNTFEEGSAQKKSLTNPWGNPSTEKRKWAC